MSQVSHLLQDSVPSVPVSDLELRLDNDEPLSIDEMNQLYTFYQTKFKSLDDQSETLFNLERNQRLTLQYYHRRNQTILNILSEIESDGYKYKEVDLGLMRSLSPNKSEIDALSNDKIDERHIYNMYLNERIPDLISDDLINLETNPQSIDSWCRRNHPSLINSEYRPITIEDEGILEEYHNGDFNLGLNEKEEVEEELVDVNHPTMINTTAVNYKKKPRKK